MQMDDKKYKTIRLKKTTVEVLKTCGNKGDTYDDIINKLMREYNDSL